MMTTPYYTDEGLTFLCRRANPERYAQRTTCSDHSTFWRLHYRNTGVRNPNRSYSAAPELRHCTVCGTVQIRYHLPENAAEFNALQNQAHRFQQTQAHKFPDYP